MNKATDETGKVYTRLTVIERDFSKKRNAYWLCKCECGKTISVMGKRLRNGNTKSCGCYSTDLLVANRDCRSCSRCKHYEECRESVLSKQNALCEK